MKTKTLLVAAFCMGAGSLFAQNLVVNGDFEQQEYVDELDGTVHDVYTWNRDGEAQNGNFTVYIPGWDRRLDAEGNLSAINYEYEAALESGTENPDPWDNYNISGANKWDCYFGLVEQVDVPTYDEDSYFYLNVRRVDNDGWGSNTYLTQTITVEPTTKYHISFVYELPSLQERKGSAPLNRKIEVLDGSDDSQLYVFTIEDDESDVEWTTIEGEFTTGEVTTIKLRAGLCGSWKDNEGKNKGCELHVDNFKIWKDGTDPDAGESAVPEVLSDKIFVNAQDGVVRIQGAEAGDRLSVFNMAGQQVVNTIVPSADFTVDTQLSTGIYVVKVNNAVRKVVL